VDPPQLPIPAAAALRAAESLAAASLPPDEAVILCPASASAPAKRWPAERFAALADLLARRGIPRAVAVGPSERGLAEAVRERSGSPLPVLGPDLDAIELAAVLAKARLVVSNDSGPAHLAGAVNTPVVVLFGPTDPARTAPSGSPTRVLRREELGEITADEAMRAVEELMGRKA
jgi:ADP-heptose:LPS heptosyltransferase